MAKKHHPDFNHGNAEMFKNVNEAYQILSDPVKKMEYDQGQVHQKSEPRYANPREQARENDFRRQWESMDPMEREILNRLRQEQ